MCDNTNSSQYAVLSILLPLATDPTLWQSGAVFILVSKCPGSVDHRFLFARGANENEGNHQSDAQGRRR